jgi:hypothetical protein
MKNSNPTYSNSVMASYEVWNGVVKVKDNAVPVLNLLSTVP